jgi:signal transduction histidine kinase
VPERIGGIPWGTHLCGFYGTPEELTYTLVSYFTAGIQKDQLCLWVTSDPSGVEGARQAFRNVAPNLERYLDKGPIEIWEYGDWYLRGGHFDGDRVLGQWIDKEKQSLDSGYDGVRIAGDVAWLEEEDWPEFMAYEAEVGRVLPQHRMIGLCTYPLDACPPHAVLRLIRTHELAVGQKEQTTHLETARAVLNERLRMKASVSEPSQRLSAHVLQQQDEERRWIAAQLHEGIAQNVSAIGIYLASLQQKRSWPSKVRFILSKCHALCEQSLKQILTLSDRLHPPMLDGLGLDACLHWYIDDLMKRCRIHVKFETPQDIGRFPLEVETHLFRIVQDALSSMVRHGRTANAVVRLERHADQVILQIEDLGQGAPPAFSAAVSGQAALEILGIEQRLQTIGGRLDIRSTDHGTMLTVSVRLH